MTTAASAATVSSPRFLSSLRLSRLTLNGFKSFADATVFTFDDALTGIVGPNGCGKSNVVDAIKWVLGERSSKSLRGKEMIDVIFAGSTGRKPSGMASVTLSFENPVGEGTEARRHEGTEGQTPVAELNADQAAPRVSEKQADVDGEVSEVEFDRSGARRRALPIDADTVDVERRLYRDGTSQYLISGKRARLKDIRDLFLDTGIGADAYSIIEQGKVDAMLMASPQERRSIFEEAAGIAKFKARKIEAERKLERANANLAVTREQLASTERRLKIVKGQAAKARVFKQLDGDLRSTKMALTLDQYEDVVSRLEGLTSRLTQLETTRREATEALAQLEQAKQDAEIARQELASKRRNLEDARVAARHAEQTATQRQAMSQRAMDDAARQAESDTARLAELDAAIASAKAAAEEQQSAIAAASERLAESEREIEAVQTERAGLLSTIAEKNGEWSQKRQASANIDRERAGLVASIEADAKREEAMGESSARLQSRRAALETDRQRLTASRGELEQTVASRRERVAGLEQELARCERQAGTLSTGRRALSTRVAELQQQHLKAESQRATLHEMVERRVGLGDAARAALEARDADERAGAFAGVIAPLAELIDTDREHAAAVEAALGATLQALVIPNLAAMPSAAELATLPGRVTLVPVAGLVESRVGVPAHRWSEGAIDPAIVASGRAMPVREVVRLSSVSQEHELAAAMPGLLDRVLGRTYLVESLDAAMMLGAVAPGSRFVTRDGVVLESDGRVHAGPAGSADESGVLARRSELAELVTAVAAHAAALAMEQAALEAADAEAAAIAQEQSKLRTALVAEQRALAGEQAKLEQMDAERRRVDREDEHVGEELAQIASRLEKLRVDREGLRERATRLAGLFEEQTARAAAIEEELATIRQRAEAINERATAMRVESSRVAEQLSAARREHRRLESAAEQAAREQASVRELVASSRSRLNEHQMTIAAAIAAIAESAARATEADGLIAAVMPEIEAAERSAAGLGERLGAARTAAMAIERDWHALEVGRRELEVKREGLEERGMQELSLDLGREIAEYRELLKPFAMADEFGGELVVTRIDHAAASGEIERLKAEIKRLGSVNLDALDEEQTLESRNDELIRQVADIDEAAKTLTEMITTLSAACRVRFEESFAQIKGHFAGESGGETGGLFRKLFGGGSAEIRLMPLVKEVETPEGLKKVETDEIDLLESGIEIIARPPGKQPRSISQLSGGEKTLTAVALLLSIFRSKPSCFCVLDEVDAALDEGNVGRYIGILREFTDTSHFIVITHNKKTMQGTDRLYGVTMQERGVSTRVDVRFEQVAKDGSIASGGPAAAVEATPRGKKKTVAIEVPETPVLGSVGAGEKPAEEGEARKSLLRAALANMRSESTPAEHQAAK